MEIAMMYRGYIGIMGKWKLIFRVQGLELWGLGLETKTSLVGCNLKAAMEQNIETYYRVEGVEK